MVYIDHPEHPEPRAYLTIAIAQDWSEESDASTRCYAEIDVWIAGQDLRMRFHDIEGTPLRAETFGAPLSRRAALESPLRDEFFRVAEQIVYDDPRVRAVLGTKP